MTKERMLVILALFVIGGGCWSIGSKAEPSPPFTDTATPAIDMIESNLTKGFLANLPEGFEPT